MSEVSRLGAASLYFGILFCTALCSAVLTPSQKYYTVDFNRTLYYKKIRHIKSIFIFLLLCFSLFIKKND